MADYLFGAQRHLHVFTDDDASRMHQLIVSFDRDEF